jgi:hypothetical protein
VSSPAIAALLVDSYQLYSFYGTTMDIPQPSKVIFPMDIPRPLCLGRLDIEMRHAHWRQGRDSHIIIGGGREDARRVIEDYVVSSYTTDDDDGTKRFIIWGSTRFRCVDVVAYPDGTSVLNVEYDSKCTTRGDMERGDGTKDMLNFTFKMLKLLGVKSVHITDTAKTMCRGTTVKVMLGPMYFLKHGMTWYETHFGFIPSPRNTEDVRRMKESRIRILDTAALLNMPCEEFTDDFVTGSLKRLEKGEKFFLVEWIKYL